MALVTGVDGAAGAQCAVRVVPVAQGHCGAVLVRHTVQGDLIRQLDLLPHGDLLSSLARVQR